MNGSFLTGPMACVIWSPTAYARYSLQALQVLAYPVSLKHFCHLPAPFPIPSQGQTYPQILAFFPAGPTWRPHAPGNSTSQSQVAHETKPICRL